MTNEQATTLVFRNEAGDYFLVPRATLEQGRVPQEQTAELEQAIAAAHSEAGGGDVQGFIAPAVAVGIFFVGELIGFGVTAALTQEKGTLQGHLHR